MANSASGNITTTAATSTTTGTMGWTTKPLADAQTLFWISGTYGTFTFTFEGTPDAGTTWIPVSAIDYATGANINGTIAPADNAPKAWIVPSIGLNGVRIKCSAISSGTVAASGQSGTYTGQSMIVVNNAGSSQASLAATAGITSSGATGAGIGYATGAGGAVTQITSRATGVTLNKLSGTITTDTTSLAAGAEAKFTVTNSTVAATDTPIVVVASGNTGIGTCVPTVTAVGAGSFDITITNEHASTAETGACVLNFTIFKGVAA